MKLNNLSVLTLLMALTVGCGKSGSKSDDVIAPKGKTELSTANATLLGKWGTITIPVTNDKTHAREGEMRVTFTISDAVFTASNICKFNSGLTIGPVDVSSAANLTDSGIELLESKERRVEGENDFYKGNCSASLKQETFNYVLSQNRLTLRAAGMKDLQLVRLN